MKNFLFMIVASKTGAGADLPNTALDMNVGGRIDHQ